MGRDQEPRLHLLLIAVTLLLAGCERSCGSEATDTRPIRSADDRATRRTSTSSTPTSPITPITPTAGGLPKPLEGKCVARVLGPDPGPTTKTFPDAGTGALPPHRTVVVADDCVKHTECAARKNGRCAPRAPRENSYHGTTTLVSAHNECIYDDCTSDEECRKQGTYEPRSELACMCDATEHNTCSFANCRSDTDCPAPFPCGPWHYCHSAADGCRTKSDCTGNEECSYSWEVKHYLCKEYIPPPG